MTTSNIPYFSSNWSDQMVKFLSNKSDEFILEHAFEICDSWGDSYKVDRVISVIRKSVGCELMLEEVLDCVNDWAGADEEW
jgi:hypothetical protein